MSFAKNIRLYRERAGMYQSALGEYLGVSAQAVSKWELGKAEPDKKCIEKMCKLFGVTADKLMDIENTGEEDEADRIRERLRRDPNFRILFSAAENVKPEHLEAAAAMLKALGNDDD